jgi:hypothetical protein
MEVAVAAGPAAQVAAVDLLLGKPRPAPAPAPAPAPRVRRGSSEERGAAPRGQTDGVAASAAEGENAASGEAAGAAAAAAAAAAAGAAAARRAAGNAPHRSRSREPPARDPGQLADDESIDTRRLIDTAVSAGAGDEDASTIDTAATRLRRVVRRSTGAGAANGAAPAGAAAGGNAGGAAAPAADANPPAAAVNGPLGVQALAGMVAAQRQLMLLNWIGADMAAVLEEYEGGWMGWGGVNWRLWEGC